MHRNTRAADADGVGTAVYWGNDSLSGKQLSELLGRPAGGGADPSRPPAPPRRPGGRASQTPWQRCRPRSGKAPNTFTGFRRSVLGGGRRTQVP